MLKYIFTFLLLAISIHAQDSYELDTRIVGGDNAPDGIAPYQVSLRIYLNKLINFHFCGGSIISNKWILTSAYCTKGLSAEILTAVVGTNLLKSGGDSYSIESITDHEDFDQKTLYNDISLLYTTEAIQFNDKVKPIALPEGDTEPGSKCLLTGWGYTDKLRLHMPNNLQLLTVPTISTYACQKKYKLKKKIDVIEKQICTYVQKGRGGCEGDSGGPLVKESRLVGIVSREVPCARGFPDIYTRVYSYLDWINGKIGN